MSYNQSRSDKSDSTQYRKSDKRFPNPNQQRGSSGAYGKGGGPAPSPSHGLPSNRSFNKRNNNNAQGGGQSRASVPTVNSSSLETSNVSTPRSAAVQNGSHVQPQFHGSSDLPVTSPAAKPAESSAPQRSNRAVPKVPTSQPSSMSSDLAAPRTPIKAPGDASNTFSFQFGSISPGFMNGMQVPARTSSAPPNLDEQKRDQARHDSFRSAPPPLPTPSAPRQQLPRKDAGAVNQPITGEAYPVPKAKKDAQVSPAPPASQQQKPTGLPMTGISMSMPFHQSQVSVQYGGPNQQLQSQGMTAAASLQMPMHMPLAMGNPPQVQPSVFVPGLQPHPMQTQGIIHQGQGLSFTTQMGPPQLPPQLSSMGITMSPQYSQQQGGKFGGLRKTTVKITHPDTHEELRLDKRADSYSEGGSSGPRSHPNVAPQSQPIPSYAPSHPMSYYPPNSYNASPLYYPPQSSVPLTSSQMAPSSQAPRFNYQVGQGPQNMTFVNPAFSSIPVNKTGNQMHGVADIPNLDHSRDVHNIVSSAPTTTIPVTVKPSSGSIGEKVADSMRPNSSHGVEKGESPKHVRPSGEACSSHSQRDSEICSESSLQQPKHSPESLASKLLPVATKQSAVSAVVSSEGLVSNPLSASVSASEESTVVVPNNEGRRRETLGRSNSIKDHQKKTGKKGHIQSKHQVGSQSTSTTNLRSRGLEQCISSNSGVSGAVEAKLALATPMTSEGVSLSRQSLLTVGGATDASELKVDSVGEGSTSVVSTESTESTSNSADVKQAQADAVEVDAIASEKGGASKDEEVITAKKYSRHFLLKFAEQYNDLPKGFEITSDSEALMSANFNISHHVERDLVSFAASVSKDKPSLDLSKTKITKGGKKKRKEILRKADAAGTTSDRYNAYKGPAEKKETVASKESIESTSNSADVKQAPADAVEVDAIASEKGGTSKDEEVITAKKYSRDFLLKFAEQYNDIPKGFEIKSDSEALMSANFNISHHVERDSYPSPGIVIDRPSGGSRIDRRGSGVVEEDRWSKLSGNFSSGGDARLDLAYGSNAAGFRPGPGGNYGVLRNSRGQTPMQYPGGIMLGPSMGSQGGLRNNPGSESWLRTTNIQKGLIPPPQTPLLVMHKAEKKYEVKQRQLQAILNNLTPQNFEKLFEQVKTVNIDNAATLTGVISQIFDKALMEPTFCEMYADFCCRLAREFPDFNEDNEKVTFKTVLLNKCEEEFERREREQEEANKADEESEIKQSAEEREEKRVKARRRMLGNIRLIGELYKKRMLIQRVMHPCIEKLLGQYPNPDEEDLEALCTLMSTIGVMMDHRRAKKHMEAYFDRMKTLSNNMNLSSRVRFMLKDAIDLRKNKWQQRRIVEGTKKIEEVHRDAAQERAQVSYEARTWSGPREVWNPDRSFDRSLATSSPARGQGTNFPPNVPSEKVWPEERLRDMSMAAIKEFYSARDEKEVELCIKELNSPSFHPLMVSLWVTDSFERKDMEREVLAKLLVDLTNSRDCVLSPAQLIKGFESVLTTLEDAVNDAPRAPEFLGRIFAKVVTENVIPLGEIGMLIHEGGEEPGRLRDSGLAADVLGTILETIKSEKGDSVLSEIRTSSNLRLEDFRPLDPNRSRKLEKFI